MNVEHLNSVLSVCLSIQVEVYRTCVLPCVTSCLEGYNATVLAYGQTSSGKSYTMGSEGVEGEGVEWEAGEEGEGVGERAGIIPRSLNDLFQHIEVCSCLCIHVYVYIPL